MKSKSLIFLIILFGSLHKNVLGQNRKLQFVNISSENLLANNVKITEVIKNGKKATKIVEDKIVNNNHALAIIKNLEFKNGIIEIEVNGSRRPDADTTFRGFIGLAFRVQEKDSMPYECFYIRPDNGRATDQLRRNHSTQYISEPLFPWHKLRKDFPGVYESYADMEPGKWIKLKIEIHSEKAKLYINNADQPCLIVNDLKLIVASGSMALWIGPGTEGYFRNLKILKSDSF